MLEDPHHDSVPSVNYSTDKNFCFNNSTNLNDIQSLNDRMYSNLFKNKRFYLLKENQMV
jgi:hypothetical protein